MSARGSSDPHLTDAELVGQCRGGRRDAFDRLVERYQRRATSVAYRLLGDLQDALEVTQEAFVRAYRGLASLEDADRFGAWLMRIVTNLSLNFRRSRGAGPRRASFDDCILDDDVSGEGRLAGSDNVGDRPTARVLAAELSEIAQKALASLPDQQRTALVLFSIEQLPQKEVAEIMGVSVEAVKWHVFQARKKLKELLAEYLTE